MADLRVQTIVRYDSYLEYVNSEGDSEGNFRLLSSGAVIKLQTQDEEDVCIAEDLAFFLKQVVVPRRLVRAGGTELRVHPVGDGRVNREPDVMVLRPEHIELMAQTNKSTVLLEMPPPAFVAEAVSPGSENSANYRRDYEWKRQQYQDLGIPEYWIIDRYRQQVTVLVLEADLYKEQTYREEQVICSKAFPTLNLTASKVLAGGL